MSEDGGLLAQRQRRLEWLDAMRGFTMILVVAHHVLSISIGLQYRDSSTIPFMVLMRMPLFFFISGFLAYRAATVWTASELAGSVWKKIRIQVLPTLVFMAVYVVMRQKGLWATLWKDILLPYKGGYWFTWVLLHMFVIYYVFAFAEQKLMQWTRRRLPSWLPIALLWLLSIAWYETNYMPKLVTPPTADWAKIMSFNQVGLYFCFFVTGNVCRRYWAQVQRVFDTKWFFPLVVVAMMVCASDFLKFHNLRMMWANLPRTMTSFTLIAITMMFFRAKETLFSKQTLVGRTLQYVGTRTLDIYLIHYLFLPVLPMLKEFIKGTRPNVMLELLISIGLAIPVIALCLLTSSVLRTSPLLAKHLFGVKQKPSQHP